MSRQAMVEFGGKKGKEDKFQKWGLIVGVSLILVCTALGFISPAIIIAIFTGLSFISPFLKRSKKEKKSPSGIENQDKEPFTTTYELMDPPTSFNPSSGYALIRTTTKRETTEIRKYEEETKEEIIRFDNF